MHSQRTPHIICILSEVRNRAWTGFELILGGSGEALGETLGRLWGARMAQDGAKRSPRWSQAGAKMSQDGAKMEPRWTQDTPR